MRKKKKIIVLASKAVSQRPLNIAGSTVIVYYGLLNKIYWFERTFAYGRPDRSMLIYVVQRY